MFTYSGMSLFQTVCFLLVFLVPTSSQLPSSDILTLLSFKKGITHDPTGYIFDSWNEESIDFNGCPSSWNGVVCNGDHVAAVVIDNHGISGVADLSVFSNLSMLSKLSMHNNNFTGALPESFNGFEGLKFLDISDNAFFGKIPNGIANLKNLQNLSFSGNNFSGSLPDSVDGLVSIQSLDFSRNALSGSLPSALKRLKSLVYLNLSHNLFAKGIPEGLADASSLEHLDLSWNQLDGDVDWSFLMESSSVAYVDLSGNLLKSSNSKELKFLAEVSETVKYLNLSNNQLTGSLIDGGAISTFGSLKVLDLSYNQLSGPLPGFDYVYDLEVLRLGNNRFDGFLPNGLLKGDSLVLNELDLSANNLSGHIGLITSTTLQVLNLSSNSITGNIPLLTGSCTAVDLSNNKLSGNLSVFEKWGNDLEYIDFSRNQLTGPFPESTSQFLRLNFLNLSHNSLSSTLPSVLVQYPKLSVLDLSYNKFDGPMLNSLLTSSTLQQLYLENNLLFGAISFSPSLPNKSALESVNLSTNRFNGTFPKDLISLTRLQALDISNNNFSGDIPPSVANLTFLTSFDISLNQFTGPLPSNLSDTLQAFNASYNDLSGAIPANLQKFPDSSFHPGNPRLDHPTNVPGEGSPAYGNQNHGKHLNTCIKIVIIVSCILLFAILILLAILLHYKMMSKTHSDKVTDKNLQSRGDTTAARTLVVTAEDLLADPKKGGLCVKEEHEEKIATFSPSKNITRYSWSPTSSGETYPPQEGLSRLDVRSPDRLAGELHFLDETITLTPEELSRAPAEVLGRSSHGTSYRATLDNGVFLTVKWLREGVAKPKKEFAKEAKKFANIRHPNVVGLRGYYWGPTQHEKLILSDYISPGSLASFLYDRPGRKGPPLTWSQRLKISVDVARGLNYLHFDRAVPHGNLKSTNILLDGLDLNARVSDYCLHRLMTQSGTTEQIQDYGVLGYRAPELATSKKPTPSFKSDIYAFGVVMLEILTGKCAGDLVDEEGGGGGVHLVDWVRLRVAEGRAMECFDQAIMAAVEGGGNNNNSNSESVVKGMKEMLGIALRCIRPLNERPGIRSVYEDLSSI